MSHSLVKVITKKSFKGLTTGNFKVIGDFNGCPFHSFTHSFMETSPDFGSVFIESTILVLVSPSEI